MKDAKEVTLESEYEKIAQIDTSNWENVRGPRPWEEGNKLYEEAVERVKKMEAGKWRLTGTYTTGASVR